jgi:hypothetical protein
MYDFYQFVLKIDILLTEIIKINPMAGNLAQKSKKNWRNSANSFVLLKTNKLCPSVSMQSLT